MFMARSHFRDFHQELCTNLWKMDILLAQAWLSTKKSEHYLGKACYFQRGHSASVVQSLSLIMLG